MSPPIMCTHLFAPSSFFTSPRGSGVGSKVAGSPAPGYALSSGSMQGSWVMRAVGTECMSPVSGLSSRSSSKELR